jgi:hypothetical protein
MKPPRESSAIAGSPVEVAWIMKVRPLRQARILGEIVFIPVVVLIVACANHRCPSFIESMHPQVFAFSMALGFSSATMSAICEIRLFLNRKCPRCRRDFFNFWGPLGEWRRRCQFCHFALYPAVENKASP